MRRMIGLGLAVLLVTGACGSGGAGGASGTTRTVLVDFTSDEFASFSLFNYPAKVTVRQGDTVNFKQTWTGEPHTVTGGTLVNQLLKDGIDWIGFFEAFEALASSGASLPNPEDPGDAAFADFATAVRGASKADARDKFVTSYNNLRAKGVPLPDLEKPSDQSFGEFVKVVETESEKVFGGLPGAFNDDELAQNVGQPCFLETGSPPEGADTPCAKSDQKQREFDGKASYYNSGIIPYEGAKGNSFKMKVAEDAQPATYLFYCAVHGFGQRSEIEIKPKGADIPSENAVSRQALKEVKEKTEPLEKVYRDAKDGKITAPGPGGEEIEGPFAGLPGEDHAAINEFVPSVIKAKVGEPITWKMMGADHTISFNVPKYFPIVEFQDSGEIRINPKLQPAAGGAVPLPDEESDGPVKHDAGTFDGTGFWSSGLIAAEPYLELTMRISKPGTYGYACLLHPPMVGKIEVT